MPAMTEPKLISGNANKSLATAIARRVAASVLADNAGHPGHVFNLGHGVLPQTPPEAPGEVVRIVREYART